MKFRFLSILSDFSSIARLPFLAGLLAAGALFLALGGRSLAADPDTEALSPLASIKVSEAKEKLTYLTSRALAGRRAGTEGARLAAEYIARCFERAGLEPGGRDGSYLAPIKIPPATMVGKDNVLLVKGVKRDFTLTPNEEFAPFSFSPNKEVTAPVVFAGYGLAKEDWNDYENVDVRGRIVLVLRHGPGWKPRTGRGGARGAGREYTFHAKALAAQENGAVGMILVTDPANLKGPDRLAFLAGGGPGVRIPCVHAQMKVGEALLRIAGHTLEGKQREMDRKGRPSPVSIPTLKVRLGTSISKGKTQCYNVVGVLRGRDPALKDECVVIGAHYDHLGFGDVGTRGGAAAGAYYPGADDNGSGTVGVMEVAEAFGALPIRPRRSIVFVAFGAEEVGLFGSRAYANKPLFPSSKTVAMLNFDMIGRGKPNKVTVAGMGTGDNFKVILEEANKEIGLDLRLAKGAGGGSDHSSFLAKKIPIMFFVTGGNPQYHSPKDTVDRIDFGNLTKASKLAFLAAARLTAEDGRPKFVPPQRQGRPRGQGVRLGFFPDDWYDGKGALMQAISPDTPASRAGLKAGDIILKYGGKDVPSIKELRTMLRETKRGSKVELVILRKGRTFKVTVQF
jgi:hypothetical protein